MNQSLRNCIVGVLLLCFCSCKTLQKNQQTTELDGKDKNKPTYITSHGPYHPSKTRKFDLLHTKLEVSFDWSKQYLYGIATLRMKPHFYSQSVLELDAKGMDIQKVELAGKSSELKFTYDKSVIRINLEKSYTKKDTISIQIKYTAKPNDLPKGGSSAITESKGLYFINPDGSDKSKPRQVWTQGETEASSCWFPTIDATNQRCTQEMYITADSNLSVLSNGEMIYSHINPNGTKTAYWKLDQPHAPYLFMMVAGEFAVVEDTMPPSEFNWEDVEIKYMVEPKFAPYAKNIFGNTPEMIDYFSRLLNFKYPWPKYTQIVVRDYVSGAMENTSATVFMEALQVDDRELLDEHWDGIISHELFHHWFGDLVTCESWANLPLNESFANYAEYLWTEHKYGRDEADLLGKKESDEYFSEARTKQEPLIRYHYMDKEDMFDRHSYNKGGRVLHMLRKYIGDDAFFTSLHLYLTRHQFKSTEIHDLRLAFEEVTGEDLNWFFNQWFLSPGHADLVITHEYADGVLKVKAAQVQDTSRTPVFKLPVALDVWVNGIKSTHLLTFEKAAQELTIKVSSQPDNVLFDSEHQLLGKIVHSKSQKEYLFQYYHAEHYVARQEALEKLFLPGESEIKGKENPRFSDPEIKQLLSKALEDPFWEIRDFALIQFSRFLIPDIEKYLPKLEYIALNDPKPLVRAKAIYLLSSYNNKQFTFVYEKGLQERPYSIAGASLASYLKTGAPEAFNKVKEFENIDNINIIIPLADFYIESNDKSKYTWFREKMNTGNAQKLYNFLGYFGQYLSLLDTAEKEDGKKILENIAKNNKYEIIRQTAALYLQMIK
jgi:aminopeptidase N